MQEAAPPFAEVMGHFAWDVPWIAGLVLAGALYLRAYLHLRRTKPRVPHSLWRTACFIAGLAVVAVAVLSPLEYWGNHLLWANFTGFLAITMIAPPLLLLGSPLTLAFRVSDRPMRARLRAFYRGPVMSALTFPVVSWLLFAVATYLWQFTTWTDDAASNVFVRDIQQLSLLAVGLLFWLPALCADPVRWRIPYPLRGLYVFVEMTHKGLFGGMFLSMASAIHPGFAAGLPAWGPSAMTDQRVAILLLWIGGNLIFLIALIGIIARWVGYEARTTARTDRRLEKARAEKRRRSAAIESVFRRSV